MSSLVTVAVLTYNGEEFLPELLQAVAAQITKRRVEVLVIDSGSSDNTLAIVKRHPEVRLHEIPNNEFSHGGTRNLAMQMAKGEYVIFLTQDAIPAHEDWLEAMIEPFLISGKVGCVVGKQVPWPSTPVTIKREVVSVFRGLGPDHSISLQRQNSLTEKRGLVVTFMSDTNSAVRKELHSKVPFRDVDYAEDQALGADMLESGYYKAYSPLGAVNHSHNYSVREYYRRKIDEYAGLRETVGYTATASLKELFIGTAKATLRDWIFLARDDQYSHGDKLKNIYRSVGYNLAVRRAIRSAARKSTN